MAWVGRAAPNLLVFEVAGAGRTRRRTSTLRDSSVVCLFPDTSHKGVRGLGFRGDRVSLYPPQTFFGSPP